MSRPGGAIFSSKVVDIVALLVRQAGGGLQIGQHEEGQDGETRNSKHEVEGALI